MRELVLNFHGLGDPPPGTDSDELPYWLDEDVFVAGLDRLVEMTHGDLPRITITFDDGNISDAKIALPALRARGMVATFFICAGRVGKPNYLDASAVEDLLLGGMAVGSHGMNHVDWRTTSERDLDTEITLAKDQLEQLCGREISVAGIPFGSYDRRVLTRLRSAGFETVYTSDGGLASDTSWMRPRNTVTSSWCGDDVPELLTRQSTLPARIRRSMSIFYKSRR